MTRHRARPLPPVRLWSDLHLEMSRQRAMMPPLIPPPAEAIVLLAGDIANGVDGVRWATETFPNNPVAYVLGNHEYYGHDFRTLIEVARTEARDTTVRVLEGETWDVAPGVRVLGATLWTDFDLWGPEDRLAAMHEARRLADATLIACEGRPLSPADSRERCLLTIAWLEAELQRAADDDVAAILLTHHAPHVLGLAPQHRATTNLLGQSFASDLIRPMEGPTSPAVWALGHTHWYIDTDVCRTRLLSNHAGYIFPGEGLAYDPKGAR